MNVIMIEVPTAEKSGSVPFGLLYAASSAYRNGHNIKILDLVKEDLNYNDVRNTIKDFKPGLIGLGGITSSYRHCKELAGNLKRDFRAIPIVAGGILSSVSGLLFKKVGIDFVVHGEGEISFPNLIDAIENDRDISKVKGLSFLRNGQICRTDDQPQLTNLDDIAIPEYTLLNMDRYTTPAERWVENYFRYDKGEYNEMIGILSNKKHFYIITARGCTHKCIFCYRHQKGWRQHSVRYVVDTMRYLRDRYGVRVIQICDELTTVNKRWVLDFCDNIINEKLNMHFIIVSSRVDMIDEEMLVSLKKAGCLMINYGYESGSDLILKEIKKGANRKQALRAGLLTKKIGLKNVPEIMIGFPSESDETVSQTIDFLKQLDTWPMSMNTPIPFPETPLWDYAVKHNLIGDEEDFILGYKSGLFVNFTRYSNWKVLRLFAKVRYGVEFHWLKKRRKYGLCIKCFLEKLFFMYIKPTLPERIYVLLRTAKRKLFK